MDALKAEIAAKRKNLEDPGVAARPTKYMRRGDLERLKEEEERKVQEETRKKEEEEEAKLRKEAATERLRVAALKVSMYSVRSVGMRLNRGWSRSPYQSRLP
jgi:pre-mRNA-splicing factor 18